jgi:hypothetical protein
MTDYTRQRAWYDPDARPNDAVTIVGCGGIGSFTTVALAKLGIPKLHLIDFDTVEEHNLPNQFFSDAQLEMPKPSALAEMVFAVNPDTQVTTSEDRFDVNNLPLNPVIIAGLDSMTARKELWGLVRMKLPVKLFLDGRLAGQRIVHYAARPASLVDVRGYEATLYSDEDAIIDSCTARSIIDVGFMIASLNVRATRLALTGQFDLIKPQTYIDQESFQTMSGGWLND